MNLSIKIGREVVQLNEVRDLVRAPDDRKPMYLLMRDGTTVSISPQDAALVEYALKSRAKRIITKAQTEGVL